MRGKWIAAAGLSAGALCAVFAVLPQSKSAAWEESSEEVVLRAFIQQSASAESGVWQGWGAQKLLEDTGISIEFYPSGEDVEDKLLRYIAAGTIPDLIGFRDLNQAQMAMEAGLLVSLDDYAQYLPSIFETEEYESAVAYSREKNSNGEGELYLMPTSIGPVSYNAYNWVPLLQWDAYKKIGMPKVETLEDYLDVVEEMLEYKPVNENGDKIYGFSLFTDWDRYSLLEVAALSYFYGIDTEYVSMLMETDVVNRVTNSILDEDSFYKRALHFYFEANQRGLLDPDSRTQTYQNLENKFSQGRVMFSWFSWLTGTYNTEAAGHVNDPDNPDGYASVVAEDMKLYEAPDQVIGRNWYLAISANCKMPEKACELLNWLYDPAVEHYLYNGPQGVTWDYDENGEPHLTQAGWTAVENEDQDLMPGDQAGSFQDGMYPFNSLGMQASAIWEDGYSISYRYWPSTLAADDSLMEKEISEYWGYDTLAEYLYATDKVAKSTIAVNMIPAASEELGARIARIGEVVIESSWDMIYAADEEEFEQIWQEMRTQAVELGMDEVEAYYQKAWAQALEEAAEYE